MSLFGAHPNLVAQKSPLDRLRTRPMKLCFIVPLLRTRTSLGIFNETDLTISLTTSAGRLQSDLEHNFRSFTTHSRSTTYKNRVQQSKQAKWLRLGRRGTHVFILKIAQRSRAIDWFWEIWRDFGGELPGRFDIAIPSFSSSVRIAVPHDDNGQVGDKKTCGELSAGKVIEKCQEMVGETIDLERLFEQRGKAGLEPRPHLALTWMSQEGTLEWLSDRTTVVGGKRDWGVLAGVALTRVGHSAV